jgi:acyl dehydratase
MPVSTEHVGRRWDPLVYAVGREKIREYAAAVGETNPLHFDLEAARAAGHEDIVAPPMFAVVYGLPAIAAAMFDPALAIDFARVVHGSQEFRWGPLVIAGDEITTTVTLKDASERGGHAFYVFESSSTSRSGAIVSTGTWTNIVRGGGE